MIKITTQAELDAALAADPDAQIEIAASAQLKVSIAVGRPWFRLLGNGFLHVVAWGSSQPHVVARGSSQLHVVAWGSSQPHVEARGSSQPHVVARESSQPHVVARESSQPHVVAWGSSQPHVVARGSSQPHVVAKAYAQLSLFGKRINATATANVSALLHAGATITGTPHAIVVKRSTAAEWCEYYGVAVTDGVATLFKALDDDFRSLHGTSYAPGEVPVAPDWDGGKAECGGGLHFSPSPAMALEFHAEAKRFAACYVALADIAVHPEGECPQKVKARGCCAPCVEVDRDGRPAVTQAGAA